MAPAGKARTRESFSHPAPRLADHLADLMRYQTLPPKRTFNTLRSIATTLCGKHGVLRERLAVRLLSSPVPCQNPAQYLTCCFMLSTRADPSRLPLHGPGARLGGAAGAVTPPRTRRSGAPARDRGPAPSGMGREGRSRLGEGNWRTRLSEHRTEAA